MVNGTNLIDGRTFILIYDFLLNVDVVKWLKNISVEIVNQFSSTYCCKIEWVYQKRSKHTYAIAINEFKSANSTNRKRNATEPNYSNATVASLVVQENKALKASNSCKTWTRIRAPIPWKRIWELIHSIGKTRKARTPWLIYGKDLPTFHWSNFKMEHPKLQGQFVFFICSCVSKDIPDCLFYCFY